MNSVLTGYYLLRFTICVNMAEAILVNELFEQWCQLRKILGSYEELLQTRWSKKNGGQCEKVLLAA